MIVGLWVTIRGFSFVSGWIAQYKQSSKKTLQKTKLYVVVCLVAVAIQINDQVYIHGHNV